MTELMTKPIPMGAYRNFNVKPPYVEPLVEEVSTDFDSFKTEACTSVMRRGIQGVVMTSLALVLFQSQAEAENEQSRPVAMSAIEGLKLLSSQKKECPKVDFHEPLRFSWSKDDDRISQAAKQYLENTNADY